MRRREISDEELNRIIGFRQIGTSWLKIQRETGIHRQTAKRAYERWEHSKSIDELKEARKDVAAQAFGEHIKYLIKLAESLVSALHVPEMFRGLGNADEVLNQLWMRNIQGELEPSQKSGTIEIRHVVRRNMMIFKALQEHTREKVRWEALEEWKQARNNTAEYSKKLRSEATEVIGNILNNQLNLKKKIKTVITSNDIAQKLSDGVSENIWRGILTGKTEQMCVVKGSSILTEGRVWIKFYKGDPDMGLDLKDVALAKEILDMCRRAAINLRRGTKSDLVRRLAHEVRLMHDRTKELEVSLDRLLLLPMILHTRCELCPA
jgi:DNA invertase Pin-like site-specific DNA recombinase